MLMGRWIQSFAPSRRCSSHDARPDSCRPGLEPGDIVELFTLDLRPIGGVEVLYFTKGNSCQFGGQVYTAVDVETEGFEWAGQGSSPRPTLKVGNATTFIGGLLKIFKDMVGAKLTRVKTYSRFLDGQPDADPEASYPPDVYFIEQKTKHTRDEIEFVLSAITDQQGRQLPGRKILSDLCLFRYRVWDSNAGAFDYSKVTCPYTGAQSYGVDNLSTTPVNDRCSRKISGCKVRFGESAPLPFGGFAGVGKFKV